MDIIYLLLRWKLCVDFRFYMLELCTLILSAIPAILKFSEIFHFVSLAVLTWS